MAKLKSGDKAPELGIGDAFGNKIMLADFKGKKLILYFYPKDNTPGCTVQAKQFTADKEGLEKLNAVVIGVSGDDGSSHKKFIDKYGINYPLLCDTDKELARKYGVYGKKQFLGKEFMGVIRSTFIIDNGRIEKAWYKVSPRKSIGEVLEYLKSI